MFMCFVFLDFEGDNTKGNAHNVNLGATNKPTTPPTTPALRPSVPCHAGGMAWGRVSRTDKGADYDVQVFAALAILVLVAVWFFPARIRPRKPTAAAAEKEN